MATRSAAQTQDALKDRSVVAGQDAYVLLAPEYVAGPTVTQAKWSSDGRYVLAVCRSERVSDELAKKRALLRDPGEPPGDLALVVWSREAHRSHEVWRRPIAGSNVEQFHWLPGAEKAVAIVSETVATTQGPLPRREVLWIRAESDSARMLTEIPYDNVPPGWAVSPLNRFEISTKEPTALIVNSAIHIQKIPQADGRTFENHEWEDAITPIRDNGTLAPTMRVPGAMFLTWSASGRTGYLLHIEYSSVPKQKPVRTYYEFDPHTGQIQQLPQEPANLHELMHPSLHYS